MSQTTKMVLNSLQKKRNFFGFFKGSGGESVPPSLIISSNLNNKSSVYISAFDTGKITAIGADIDIVYDYNNGNNINQVGLLATIPEGTDFSFPEGEGRYKITSSSEPFDSLNKLLYWYSEFDNSANAFGISEANGLTICSFLNNGTPTLNYFLVGDIDCSAIANFIPIGSSLTNFGGDFDGRGFEVDNLTINGTTDYTGLFGISVGNLISNIGIGSNSIISSVFEYTGTLIGLMQSNAEIKNSYSKAEVNGTSWTGGLIGANRNLANNCYATGNVTGTSYVGGLVGRNQGSSSNSFATGNVTGDSYVGGLVGINANGDIFNSFAIGIVLGNIGNSFATGGLVGRNEASDDSINNSFATGNVTGDVVGGLFADMINALNINSWQYDGQILTGTIGYVSPNIATVGDLNTQSWHNSVIGDIQWDTNQVNLGFYPKLFKKDTNSLIPNQPDVVLPI